MRPIPDYGPFYVGNPKLQPEKIRSVEGILEQGLGSHLPASGSVFYNRITNLITLETDPNYRTLRIRKFSGSNSQGRRG